MRVGPRLLLALEALGLAAVLIFVASVAYLPHADAPANAPGPDEGPALWRLAYTYGRWLLGSGDDYEYPVHVDENAHWVFMTSLQRADTLRYPDAYSGGDRSGALLSLRSLVHERGYHVALASFQEMTGIEWHDIIRFLPALWLPVSAALVWGALRPSRYALPAAALVALIPTSARFLGPGFLVPAGFGLAWIAAALMLLSPASREVRPLALLLILAVWAFFIHLIVGAAVLLLIVAALPFLREERRGMALFAGVVLLPVVWLLETFRSDVADEFAKFGRFPQDLTAFDQIGVPFIVLWAAGCALVFLRFPGRPHVQLPVQAASAASVITMGFIMVNLSLDLNLYALYDRWHQVFALLGSVPAAFAMVQLARHAARVPKAVLRAGRPGAWKARLGRPLAFGLGLGLLAVTSSSGVAGHMHEPYYHILDDRDWAAFQWVAANVNETYDVFLAHPWKAPVLTAMTGKQPHTWLVPGHEPVNGQDYAAFLRGRGDSGVWLVEREISLVVDPRGASSDEFVRTAPSVFELDWQHAEELQRLRRMDAAWDAGR